MTSVWEPDPKTPASHLQSGKLLRNARTRLLFTLLGALLVALGIICFWLDVGPAAAVLTIYFGAVVAGQLGWGAIKALVWAAKWQWHPDLAYEQVTIPPDGLVTRRRTVAARLPDGRWLHVRLLAGTRVQLAGERRLWLVRSGDQALVAVPGTAALRQGTVRDEPMAGGRELPVVPREFVPPRLDPVLATVRRGAVRSSWLVVAVYAVLAVLAGWSIQWIFAHRNAGGPDAVVQLLLLLVATVCAVIGVLCAIYFAVNAVRISTSYRADTWTELTVAKSLAQLPDGRTIHIRLPRAQPSLALNVQASQTLWTFGPAKPGRVRVGVPGYPASGEARLKVVEVKGGTP
ncbi:hypothetical protein VSH64_37885 [Amycolatopsis rhabdoformis]|uniref:PH domain-containing protein n=1 Tax=Amycolatopsis rhabdoformis TaxID=1448059 RepID=A0ABZ1I2G5_9PSEU|nr:hypothetical protein [Amycolatopsis rhabdoformis]WSE28558.1 hypothetical protein VSH64_37885 [Amycolatopsis rhabdoformis]